MGLLHNSLKGKLIFVAVNSILIPFIIIVLILSDQLTRVADQDRQSFSFYTGKNVANTINEVVNNIDQVSMYLLSNESIRSYLSTPRVDKIADPAGYLRLQHSADLAMNFLPFSSEYIIAADIFSTDGRRLCRGQDWPRKDSPEEWEEAKRLRGSPFWINNSDAAQTNYASNELAVCRLVRDMDNLKKPLGYIKIYLKADKLREILTNRGSVSSMDYILIDGEGQYLCGTSPDWSTLTLHPQLQYDSLLARGEQEFYLKELSSYVTAHALPDNNILLYSLFPDQSRRFYSGMMLKSAAIAALCCCLMTGLMIVICSRSMIRPLEKMGELMNSIGNENYSVRFNAHSNDEIGVLAQHFNTMSERLQFLYEQVYLDKLKLNEAEIRTLQAEINPHFLYNTLDTIYWMSELHHVPAISSLVKSLSRLFRFTLEKSEGGMVPLSRELEQIKSYLEIQRVRYQGRITFELYAEENLEAVPVLKLLLQPIVENAIIHGLEPKGGGKLLINVYRDEGALCYVVFDNGVGAEPERIAELMEHPGDRGRGFALHNVQERIRLKFGKEYGLAYRRAEGGAGSVFTIRQPCAPPERGVHERNGR